MDGEDYEYTRNLTLMFFLDRLMDKGQPRTLHDLSCQFGTKGFTKEMRSIAGGSQSGLKKFLSQFPSLFTIIGDDVFITSVNKGRNGSESKRDYLEEALDYFVSKLTSYGPAMVPIRSLLGHRSQAPLEIRHVSGQNSRDFKDFLSKRSDVFVITDEYVCLKSVLDHLVSEGKSITSLIRIPEEVTIDPYLTSQLVDFIEKFLFKRIILTGNDSLCMNVDNLFNQLKSSDLNDSSSHTLITSPSDLITVLKMNSKRFHVQSRDVALTVDRIKFLKESKRLESSSLNDSGQSSPDMIIQSKGSESSGTTDQNVQEQKSSEVQEQRSNVSEQKMVENSLGQRVRSHIMKAMADNMKSGKSGSKDRVEIHNNNHQTVIEPGVILRRTKLISKTKEGEELINQILMKESAIAVDLEGVSLGIGGSITLVQIATFDSKNIIGGNIIGGNLISDEVISSPISIPLPQVYLFDVLLNPELMNPLKQLFESESLVKIFHDCRNDSAALFFNHKIQLKNVFDTQVTHAVIQQQESGRAAYKSKFISLSLLNESYGSRIVINTKKELVKKSYKKDNRFWSHRPLTEDMILYAASDVFSLVPDVYLRMKDQVRQEYHPLLKSMTEESVLASIKPEEVKANRKWRKIHVEVMDLKVKLSNSEAKVIVLSNREIRLLRYIDLTEEIIKKIDSNAKVAKKIERLLRKETSGNFDHSDSDEDEEDGQSNSNSSENDSNTIEKMTSSDFDTNDEHSLSSFTSSTTPSLTMSSFGHQARNDQNRKKMFLPSSQSSPSLVSSGQESLASGQESLASGQMKSCCSCSCHSAKNQSSLTNSSLPSMSSSLEVTSNPVATTSKIRDTKIRDTKTRDSYAQTLSTGDIVITKVIFDENE